MANLTIEVPDELVRSLEGIAASHSMSIQQLALERLRSLVASASEPQAGTAAELLRVMREPPDLSAADMDELDAAILAGRLPVRTPDLF
ncbi:MAG: hypothetical protein ABSB15_14060 [Bryobacteraceae bacterium]